MARPKNPFPELRRYRGQWCVYVNRQRTLLGNDRMKAEAKRVQIIQKLKPGAMVPIAAVFVGSNAELGEALYAYRLHISNEQADPRMLSQLDTAIEAAVAVHGAMPAAEFRGRALKAVREHLLVQKSKAQAKKLLSRTYINHLVNSIKAAWTWLVSEEIVPADSLAAVRSVRALKQGEGGRETGPVAPVEKWVVDATLPYLSPAITNMVKIQRLVGMRSGELVRMRRRDISISPAERIDIPGIDGRKVSAVKVGNTTIWIYCPATHKNLHRRQSRCVAIGPEAQALLGPILMKRLPDEYLFQPAEQIGACGRAMIAAGQFYGVRAYARAIARAVERANRDREERNARVTAGGTSEEEPLIPKWRPGQLRHNAAETAADQVGADEAAAMLGHAASRRAIDSYVQASILRAAETAAKVG